MYDPKTKFSQDIQTECVAIRVNSISQSFPLAIWKVGTSLLRLLWSAYFDDFPLSCETKRVKSRHVDFCVDAIFSLLGWRIYPNRSSVPVIHCAKCWEYRLTSGSQVICCVMSPAQKSELKS